MNGTMRLSRSNWLVSNAASLLAHVASLMLGVWAICAVGAAAGATDQLAAKALLFVLITLLAFLTATRLRALGNIMHECTHGHFFTSRGANNRLGQVIGVCLLQSYRKYAQDHKTHHSHLAEVRLDRDLARYQGAHKRKGVANNFWDQLRLALNWQCLRAGLSIRVWERTDSLVTNLARLLWILFIMAAIAFWLKSFAIAGVLLCLFLFYPVLCVWSDLADHFLELTETKHPDAAAAATEQKLAALPVTLSRNHIFSSRLLNLILLPRNDGFHLVHHLFPATPIVHYPAKHHELMHSWKAYRELSHHLSLEFRLKRNS